MDKIVDFCQSTLNNLKWQSEIFATLLKVQIVARFLLFALIILLCLQLDWNPPVANLIGHNLERYTGTVCEYGPTIHTACRDKNQAMSQILPWSCLFCFLCPFCLCPCLQPKTVPVWFCHSGPVHQMLPDFLAWSLHPPAHLLPLPNYLHLLLIISSAPWLV